MQEIYFDIVEQKNTATLIMKKMLSFMKESEDMSVIGPVIKEQQKIADCLSSIDYLISAQSQKIELLKEHKKGEYQPLTFHQ